MSKWHKFRNEDANCWQCTFCGTITPCEAGKTKVNTDYQQACRKCGKTRRETMQEIEGRSARHSAHERAIARAIR